MSDIKQETLLNISDMTITRYFDDITFSLDNKSKAFLKLLTSDESAVAFETLTSFMMRTEPVYIKICHYKDGKESFSILTGGETVNEFNLRATR